MALIFGRVVRSRDINIAVIQYYVNIIQIIIKSKNNFGVLCTLYIKGSALTLDGGTAVVLIAPLGV